MDKATRDKFIDFLQNYVQEERINKFHKVLNERTKYVTVVLENIIQSENKDSPYSDDILVQILSEKGYLLARRTIAKYRDQLGYPVARLRKKIVIGGCYGN